MSKVQRTRLITVSHCFSQAGLSLGVVGAALQAVRTAAAAIAPVRRVKRCVIGAYCGRAATPDKRNGARVDSDAGAGRTKNESRGYWMRSPLSVCGV
jgi:hypothetical protein